MSKKKKKNSASTTKSTDSAKASIATTSASTSAPKAQEAAKVEAPSTAKAPQAAEPSTPSARPTAQSSTASANAASQPSRTLLHGLFTTGYSQKGEVLFVWFANLLAAIAWNTAIAPFAQRSLEPTTPIPTRIFDIVLVTVGIWLLLRVVTLFSEWRNAT